MGKKRIRKEAFERFDMILNDDGKLTKTLELSKDYKYAVFSDLHIGDGTGDDNFKQNEDAFVNAVNYYRDTDSKYSIILLGDIEEFHQFELIKILARYNDSVYDALQKFSEEKIHRVYGNHDIDWALQDPLMKEPKGIAIEAIKLKKDGNVPILLTHGHQATTKVEKSLHLVRFGTSFFKIVEELGKVRSKSMLREKPGYKDKIYSDWAEKNKKILICGHTHCPIFASHFIDYSWIVKEFENMKKEIKKIKKTGKKKEISRLKKRREWLYREKRGIEVKTRNLGFQPTKSPKRSLSRYFYNAGGCLFRDGITNIEIDEEMIRLVYWFNKDNQREMLWQSKISSIIA